MAAEMSFTAAGDALILKHLPGRYDGFDEITEYIGQADFRFINLETTLHDYEEFASQFSGGSWLCAPPEVLGDIREFGFNVVSFANNHTLDFSYGGLVKTLEYVKKAGFVNAGTGMDLQEASAPAYIDCHGGRAALISAVSTFHPTAMAGEQNRYMKGRPGVNGLRIKTKYRITKAQMAALKETAAATWINGYNDIIRSEGYLPPLKEGEFEFGGITFETADIPGKKTAVHEADMKRIERSIYEAQFQADFIIVSVHSHEVRHAEKSEPDEFLIEFSRRCIDCGANAVIGHGPHLLRPVEIYKGCPIFYSLGDFVLHNENLTRAPADMFAASELPPDSTIHDFFKKRTDNFTRGLQTKSEMWETVIPYWEIKDGKLAKLTLLASELGFGQPRSISGWPTPAKDSRILERLNEMSAPYGITMKISGNRAEVVLDT